MKKLILLTTVLIYSINLFAFQNGSNIIMVERCSNGKKIFLAHNAIVEFNGQYLSDYYFDTEVLEKLTIGNKNTSATVKLVRVKRNDKGSEIYTKYKENEVLYEGYVLCTKSTPVKPEWQRGL